MAPIQSSSVTVVPQSRLSTAEPDADRTIVFVQGEHDASTVAELSLTLASAIALNDADLVVDLADVSFMGAATVGVLARAARFLRLRSRSLVLRSPPSQAQRILELRGPADLIDPRPASAVDPWGVDASSPPGYRMGHGVAEPASLRPVISSGKVSYSQACHPAGRGAVNIAPRGAS